MLYLGNLLILLIISVSFVQQPKYNLEVVITGLKNSNGQLMISLNKGDEDFPDGNYYRQLYIPKFTSPEFSVTFMDLPKGNYAVSLLHDEDANGEMNKNLFGIPKEGFAFSQNYKVVFRAPKYNEANFEIDTVKQPIKIKMQY